MAQCAQKGLISVLLFFVKQPWDTCRALWFCFLLETNSVTLSYNQIQSKSTDQIVENRKQNQKALGRSKADLTTYSTLQ